MAFILEEGGPEPARWDTCPGGLDRKRANGALERRELLCAIIDCSERLQMLADISDRVHHDALLATSKQADSGCTMTRGGWHWLW